MTALILNLKGIYFDAIESGEKTEEFRLVGAFWDRRLVGRTYDCVIVAKGYPARGQADRRIVFKWKGYQKRTITHPHFGCEPVEVYAIDCSERI